MGRPAIPMAFSTTRSRVLVGALSLLAATIAVSILVDRAVLLARLDERIDRELSQEVDEFRRLAGGSDPATAEPFGDDIAAIFDTFLSRNAPGEDEVMLTLLDGQPYARTPNAPYPIEDVEELIAAWSATTEPRFRTDETPGGTVRSLAVPIQTSDDERAGTFIVARFPAGERAEVDEAVTVAAIVGAGAFVIAAALAWAIAGRVLAPLRELATATAQISEENLEQRIPVRGSGELAELTFTFNGMLDRVDEAFAVQRSFLDDASHELRTPLTVVQGHVELIEPGEPLPLATKDLILDEIDRMGRIVNDLLTLAKSEQPDFIIPGLVDVADLTVEVTDKAKPLGDRKWEVEPDAIVVLSLDRQRIIQAWMNLIRNAVQHTEDGDRITVFSRVHDGAVELGVADTGVGVREDDRERIFKRFGQGRSRLRTRSDGVGLGLSIADVIIESSGGEIRLEETPGGGATFLLRLPMDDSEMLEDRWLAF